MLEWLKANVFLTQWISAIANLVAAFAGVIAAFGGLLVVFANIYPIAKKELRGFLRELQFSFALLTALIVLRFSTSQKATDEAGRLLIILGAIYLITMATQGNLKAQEAA